MAESKKETKKEVNKQVKKEPKKKLIGKTKITKDNGKIIYRETSLFGDIAKKRIIAKGWKVEEI
tara:strand:+ start:960 stop:1151 length:192 start_codon:yes stop_codon:yes gene_type:complete